MVTIYIYIHYILAESFQDGSVINKQQTTRLNKELIYSNNVDQISSTQVHNTVQFNSKKVLEGGFNFIIRPSSLG